MIPEESVHGTDVIEYLVVHQPLKPMLQESTDWRDRSYHQRRTHEEEAQKQKDAKTMPYLMPLLDRDNRRRNVRQRILPCPWGLLSGSNASKHCSARYARLYDLRRHMESAHALHVSDEDLSDLLPEETRLLPNKRTKIDTTVH
ncbi:hypothetical protein MYAM1_001280 [Malassezia yamatoensis]|uniref:Uncharacterized protein n=1 Tax=Malassezia yamatoensis TaxID=253288 RepID=A0AAJ5YRS2_9BASI|nr:hypothetical protein MYAM1_001280 [Malassezia yamatoensis]